MCVNQDRHSEQSGMTCKLASDAELSRKVWFENLQNTQIKGLVDLVVGAGPGDFPQFRLAVQCLFDRLSLTIRWRCGH